MRTPISFAAWQRVRRNHGAPGADGETVEAFDTEFSHRLPLLQAGLLAGTFCPKPVRAFEVKKESGGMRVLGIPTVTDRLVLQSLTHILTPLWEPSFSACSFAYRVGFHAHDAVAAAQRILQTGLGWVVDLDIEKFFDNVDQVHLMQRLGLRLEDSRLLDLIADFLRCGQSWDGEIRPTRVGIAQGSPLSPLLANITLDELDKEFERHGWPFVRYADDCILFARTETEGREILAATDAFLQARLKLRLHPKKSRVVRPAEADHLGFTFRLSRYGQVRRHATREALDTFRQRIDELTRPHAGKNLESIIENVATYARGWSLYYGFCQDGTLRTVRGYIRGRFRALAWEYWRSPEERCRQLQRLGLPAQDASRAAYELHLPDEVASLPVLAQAMPNAFFDRYGLGDKPAAKPKTTCRPSPTTTKSDPESQRLRRAIFEHLGWRLRLRPVPDWPFGRA